MVGSGKSSTEVQVKQATEALEAAEEYADTRARLLEEREAATEGETPLYQSEEPDGSTYFGDRPSPHHGEDGR